jgi:aryl-alcohol dehydrogenase-like predicted oxidoreductase
MYANGVSEKRVGELTHDRDDLVVATKFPWNRHRASPTFLTHCRQSRNLGRDVIDLYQHHFPSKRVPIPELMNLMADAVEKGKVRAVGVSNYSEEQMRLAHSVLDARGIPLASNQAEYSLLRRQPEIDGVLDACEELQSRSSPAHRWRAGR